jgi:polysaccharide export outer membrane protein
MNPLTLQSILRSGGLCFSLAFTLLLAGCGSLAYNDPNVPAGARYFNTAGAQPIHATAIPPANTAAVPPVNTAGAQPILTAAIQPVNTAGVQPRAVDMASNAPIVPAGQAASRLGVGDLLTVNFSDIPPGALPAEQQHRIGDDGLIILPFNVQVQAAGKTPTQLQKEIRSRYVPDWFVNLTVVVKAQDRFVYVDGEVKVPNRQFHIDGLTVLRAISTAGGFTDFAKRSKIEVRRAGSGKTELIDWNKARKNPKLDLPLYVNDQVYVPRSPL